MASFSFLLLAFLVVSIMMGALVRHGGERVVFSRGSATRGFVALAHTHAAPINRSRIELRDDDCSSVPSLVAAEDSDTVEQISERNRQNLLVDIGVFHFGQAPQTNLPVSTGISSRVPLSRPSTILRV